MGELLSVLLAIFIWVGYGVFGFTYLEGHIKTKKELYLGFIPGYYSVLMFIQLAKSIIKTFQ